MGLQAESAREILSRYPKTPTLTLARILYSENKELFPSLDAARSSLRKLRGAHGEMHRKTVKKINDGPATLNPFANLPEGLTHFDQLEPYPIVGDCRIAILSDAHIPYHDKQPLLVALEHLRKLNPTHIVLNGDMADFFSVSFWEKDPRKRDLAGEIKAVREFLSVLRGAFPDAIIIWKDGNHEERWTRYLSVKAPEVLGVADFEIPQILRFDNAGIQYVNEGRLIKSGGLNIIHGHEFRWGITSPVNPARGFYQRGKENMIGGHLHQSSNHSEKSMNDTIVSCWSTGCLCDLKPEYARYNKWNHGFATVELDKAGDFVVSNHKIIHNRIF